MYLKEALFSFFLFSKFCTNVKEKNCYMHFLPFYTSLQAKITLFALQLNCKLCPFFRFKAKIRAKKVIINISFFRLLPYLPGFGKVFVKFQKISFNFSKEFHHILNWIFVWGGFF